MSKTNAIRLIEHNKVKHEVFTYEFKLEEIDAVSVAHKISADPDTVFKTLIAKNEKNDPFVFVIPGNFNLNLKKAAKVSSSKKIEMIKEKELLPLTGYIKGGCSPIGMKKQFPTFIDETAQLWDSIFVSAGIRGTQVKINPLDLKDMADATFADII
jgi:Cys-tRNA(Pro)/Cys-tRNA(Cys) deacylase